MNPVIEMIARTCHEVNRAYCIGLGDLSQLPWDQAPDWQRESVRNGVRFHIANPGSSPAASHENWLKEKIEQGWVYGPVKDAEAKTHPCCLPYEDLPEAQKTKDRLFIAVVGSLK
jgi:hypothetical protein